MFWSTLYLCQTPLRGFWKTYQDGTHQQCMRHTCFQYDVMCLGQENPTNLITFNPLTNSLTYNSVCMVSFFNLSNVFISPHFHF